MGSTFQSLLSWAKPLNLCKESMESETPADLENPDTFLGQNKDSAQEQHERPHEGMPTLQSNRQNTDTVVNNGEDALEKCDITDSSHSLGILPQQNTTIAATVQIGLRGSIAKEVRAGGLDIPPFRGHPDLTIPAARPACQFPDALLDADSISPHRRRFDRSALVPDSNLPLQSQIMGYAVIWGRWIAEADLADEAMRERLLDRVFTMATAAWSTAIQVGYKPDTAVVPPKARKAPAKRLAARAEELPLGLRGRHKLKRDASPSQMPVVVASHKSGLAWAVTAGELQQAGVSETRIRRRAADHEDLEDAGQDLADRIVTEYNGQIRPADWYKRIEETHLNPMGRNLQIYSIYEFLKCQHNIEELEGFYKLHKTSKQRENTQKRIDEEQERQDVFMALALELEEDSPRPATPPISAPATTLEALDGGEPKSESAGTAHLVLIESLVNTAKLVLEEDDITCIRSTLELYEIAANGDRGTRTPFENLTSNADRCQQILEDMMSSAEEWQRLSSNKEIDADATVQIQNVQAQIEKGKESFAVLVPALIAELEKTGAEFVEDGTAMHEVTRDVDANARAEGEALTAGTTLQESDVANQDVSTAVTAENGLVMTDPSHSVLSAGMKRPREVGDENNGSEEQPSTTKRSKSGDEIPSILPICDPASPEVGKDNPTPFTNNHSEPKELTVPSLKSLPTRRITLHFRSPFEPQSFSNKKLFNVEGFWFRYSHDSSLAERRSAGAFLTSYVQQFDHQQGRFKNETPFGTYQGLFSPYDPNRKIIIHGVWDLKDGTHPSGFEEFYNSDSIYSAKMDNFDDTVMAGTEADAGQQSISPPTQLATTTPVPNLPRKQRQPRRKQTARPSTAGLAPNHSKITRPHSTNGQKYGTVHPSKPFQIHLTMKKTNAAAASDSTTTSGTRPRRQSAKRNYYEDMDNDWNPDDNDLDLSD